MAGWQDKVVQVMLADTSDLRELARLAGYDPALFWRDANFRKADLSGQSLEGLDLSAAILPPRAALRRRPSGADAEMPADPPQGADAQLARGLDALDRSIADWAHADVHLVEAIDLLAEAARYYVGSSNLPGELEARYALVVAQLLRSQAAPEQAQEALDRAERALHPENNYLYRSLDPDFITRVRDARGMMLRFQSRDLQAPAAVERLEQAKLQFETAADATSASLPLIHQLGALRELLLLSGGRHDDSAKALRDQATALERIWSPVTGIVPSDVAVAAKIEHCAFRLTLSRVTRQPLATKAQEDIRAVLTAAMWDAAEQRLYLDWVEGQRCLTELDALYSAPDAVPDGDAQGGILDMARAEALRRAHKKLAEGDGVLRSVLSAPEPDFAVLDAALAHFAAAEDYFGLLEDVAPVENDPGRAYAILRRGMTHLLKVADDALTGQAQADACNEARFALDMAAARLAGRGDVPMALAETLDAQAFGMRIEAHFSTAVTAAQALAEAAALHRRASRVEGLNRAVSYRYRTHFFAAEREMEARRGASPEMFTTMRQRARKALDNSERRRSERTTPAQQASHMSVVAEYAMALTTELKHAHAEGPGPAQVVIEREIDPALQTAMGLAVDLFMPLDWMLLRRTRAQVNGLGEGAASA